MLFNDKKDKKWPNSVFPQAKRPKFDRLLDRTISDERNGGKAETVVHRHGHPPAPGVGTSRMCQ
jgi:hypothetical protein